MVQLDWLLSSSCGCRREFPRLVTVVGGTFIRSEAGCYLHVFLSAPYFWQSFSVFWCCKEEKQMNRQSWHGWTLYLPSSTSRIVVWWYGGERCSSGYTDVNYNMSSTVYQLYSFWSRNADCSEKTNVLQHSKRRRRQIIILQRCWYYIKRFL